MCLVGTGSTPSHFSPDGVRTKRGGAWDARRVGSCRSIRLGARMRSGKVRDAVERVPTTRMDITLILSIAGASCAGILALVMAMAARRSPTQWVLVAGLGVLAAESLCTALTADAVLPQAMIYWQNWRLVALSFLPGLWLCFSLSYARGNYREFLIRWRLLLAGAFLLPVGLAVGFHGRLIVSIAQTGAGLHWLFGLGTPGICLILLFLISAILLLMNLERTFRTSVGTMRWRIKFMILGLVVLFAVRAYTSSQFLLFRGIDLSLDAVNSGTLIVACLLVLRSLLRAGHFDVNVYPSHSVLHNSLTVLLTGIYLLIVGVFAKVVTFLGGDDAFQLQAFLVLAALVLLTILLLSERLRLLTKRFVSRHFQRPLYDYRTVWRSLTEGTASRVEQTDLCRAVARSVSEIFQVLSVTVWLVDERKERLLFGASTSLTEAQAKQPNLSAAQMAQVIDALREHPGPLDIESSGQTWTALLRRLHPDEFREGGNRICVPMTAGGELLGVITLGDRVGAVPCSLQDFDLLKSVSDQVAANLLNIHLSQRLAQAKQFEAFQAMSAFFVHDLKNTATTLSLMLQNLPVHFNDPGFRQDALRGISKTVVHINDLNSRLSRLGQDIPIHAVDSDLNVLVTEALKGLVTTPPVELVSQLRPLPKVRLDPVQIQNVVTNLVLNASDAVGAAGRITVETSQQNGCVVLAVADTGCGMSPEFVQQSLFRPFQTTKKAGIGIGMFQCKMIVEAHRGRIKVESEPGKGTAFRVSLPIHPIP